MGKQSLKKGKRGELELAHFLSDNGFAARRGQQFSGSPDSPDVICKALPLHIECKRTERLSVYEALAQAEEDGDLPGVVFHRRNKKHWIAILDAKTLLDLIRE